MGAVATFAGLVLARGAGATAVPKETGLSFEGLLANRPGFQPRQPAPLAIPQIAGFLSKAQLASSYQVYRDAFAQLLAAERALQTIPRTSDRAADYVELRRRQIRAGNSVLLHEFYLANLAARPIKPPTYLRDNMVEHMGSFEAWSDDFGACARVAETWAVLLYDPYNDRWHNAPLAETDAGGWVGGNPLVVCDVSKEAWAIDYQDRDTYIARFIEHIDWRVVAERYRAVDRQ